MILSAREIYKTYTVDSKLVPVLKGVSLDVKEGEILVIQGPSGAGKSTLLHILGLLDDFSKGEVIIDGTKFKKGRVNAKLRAKYIGFVFQFYNLLPDFNVLENVCLPAMIAKGSCVLNKNLVKQAKEMLEWVGLTHRLNHRPNELSGGEQQRAALARALINKPKLLLADEPTGNLDSANSEKIWSLLVKLRDEQKQTVIIVTHNNELAKLADRNIHLVDGVIR
jgi:lipoprotein-releasing system ATP-binding protein